jgi:hypothetical protein
MDMVLLPLNLSKALVTIFSMRQAGKSMENLAFNGQNSTNTGRQSSKDLLSVCTSEDHVEAHKRCGDWVMIVAKLEFGIEEIPTRSCLRNGRLCHEVHFRPC